MKVYVVTSGEYSDYSIEAIFSTKELAQQYIDERMHSHGWFDINGIDEWEVDDQAGKVGEDKWWRVTYLYSVFNDSEQQDIDVFYNYPVKRYELVDDSPHRCELQIYVTAVDGKGAAKIASEIRAQLVADNKWFAKNPFDKGEPTPEHIECISGGTVSTTYPEVRTGDVSITMNENGN